MNAPVRSADCIYHAIDDAHSNSVPGNAHRCTRQPAVVHGVVAVQCVGVHVAIRRVVSSTYSVEKPTDHAGCKATARYLQVSQPQPGSSAGIIRLQVAERLTKVTPCCVDELWHLGCSAGNDFGGFVEGEVLEDLGQVVFTLGVPFQGLKLGLEEVWSEGMAADSL